MKKKYEGLSLEKISFETNSNVVMTSLGDCIEIVANTVVEGTNYCSNPKDNTSHIWFGDNPYGD